VYFEALIGEGAAPRTAMHWLSTQVIPAVKERQIELSNSPVTPARLAVLLKMLSREEINANAARKVIVHLFETDETPEAVIDAHGYRQVSDPNAFDSILEKVLAAETGAVADAQSGQAKAIGFLVGKVMKASGGKANPKIIRESIAKKIGVPS
jgi:aspartyl-tRNA(Asn)/glutamyl-tRNA(Gln) amidotransferase subunit B